LALNNVAVAYENYLLDLHAANEALLRLAQNYPKSDLAGKSLLKAAYNYQVLGEFDLASKPTNPWSAVCRRTVKWATRFTTPLSSARRPGITAARPCIINNT
jgi:hypothetical protein